MKIRTLWLSKHPPSLSQVDDLRALIRHEYQGQGCDLLTDIDPFINAEEVDRRMRVRGIDEVVFIGPQTILSVLCDLGREPLRAVLERCDDDPAADIYHKGKRFRHVRFERVTGITVHTKQLHYQEPPCPQPSAAIASM